MISKPNGDELKSVHSILEAVIFTQLRQNPRSRPSVLLNLEVAPRYIAGGPKKKRKKFREKLETVSTPYRLGLDLPAELKS